MLVKKLKRKVLALISVFFLSFSFSMSALNELNSGSAATQQGETDNLASIDIGSFAYVLTVLGIEETQVMSFGAFTPGSGGTINTSGDTTGGVTSIQNVTNITNAQPSVISMTGDPEENFSLVINGLSPIVTLTNTADNSQTMTMDLDLVQEDRTFSEAGSSSKSISGTLNVGANQLAGLYSGTYTVEIFYIN